MGRIETKTNIYSFKIQKSGEKVSIAEKKYPGVTFILAHLIGIEEFDSSIGENVYFDISCPLLHSTKMLIKAWNNFGAERILLGSDAPYGTDNLNLAINQMRIAGMNNDQIELVCSKNIQKLLNVD